jgi:hypothetical protein
MTNDFELWEQELARRSTFRAMGAEMEREALVRAAIELEA